MKNTNTNVGDARIFKTIVKKNNKSRDDDYILGWIVGMKEIICDDLQTGRDKAEYESYDTELGMVLRTKCTLDKYEKFMDIVSRRYPGVCVFGYTY